MGLLDKIKGGFSKPEVHPETHEEQVAKVIDDICVDGLKKGLSKSEMEIHILTGMDLSKFKKMLEPTLTPLFRPGEYQTVAGLSDKIGMGLDEDQKARLRLSENALNALGVILLLDHLGKLDENEFLRALRTVYGYHTILPPHSEQIDTLIKDIAENGFKKGIKDHEDFIGYLTRLDLDSFKDAVKPQIKALEESDNEKLLGDTTDALEMHLDDDKKKRFLLEENALEAFATLRALKSYTPISDEEEKSALKEIFRHSYLRPNHSQQLATVIRKICASGFEKGVDSVAPEIKYLTGMTPKEFKNDARLSVKMIRQKDLTDIKANAALLTGKNWTPEERDRLIIKDNTLDALGVLDYLAEHHYLRGNEENEALIEIFKDIKIKDLPK